MAELPPDRPRKARPLIRKDDKGDLFVRKQGTFGGDELEVVLSYVDRGLESLAKGLLEEIIEPLIERIEQLEAHPLKYCDVWKSGGDYRAGNFVSWGGSVWHCNEDATTEKPGTSAAWTLAVKRGRDGKDAKP